MMLPGAALFPKRLGRGLEEKHFGGWKSPLPRNQGPANGTLPFPAPFLLQLERTGFDQDANDSGVRAEQLETWGVEFPSQCVTGLRKGSNAPFEHEREL